jgi:hypothetical protein
MLPVNMRGAVVRQAEAPPHMSFLTVDMAGTSAPEALQTQIEHCFQQGQHWGMWPLFHAGRVMGEEGMRKDIRKRERQGHGVTGMFSNLGVWNVDGGGSWLFCPAITRTYPIGAGCITVNGRLALTLQLHDALGATLGQARATLDEWAKACFDAIERTHSQLAPTSVASVPQRPVTQSAFSPDSTEFSS